LVTGGRARASDVESKFDFSEYSLWPHAGGVVADNTYDLGNSTSAYWRTAWLRSINATTTAAGLAIGTTTADAGAILDLAGTKALLLPRLSTTQRDALTPKDGMLIFNSSTSQYQVYRNASWAILGGTVFSTKAVVNTTTSATATAHTLWSVAAGGGRIHGLRFRGGGGSGGNRSQFNLVLDGVTAASWQHPTTTADWTVVDAAGVLIYATHPDSTAAVNPAPGLQWDFASSATLEAKSTGLPVTATAYVAYAQIV
jgi:hypothetical protein